LPLSLAWTGTVTAAADLLLTSRTWDNYYGVLGWLVASFVGLTSEWIHETATKRSWRAPALVWAFSGCWVWLLGCYLQNQRGAFHAGLLVVVILLILCLVWFHPRPVGAILVITLLLFVAFLPLGDLVIRRIASQATDPSRKYYSFEVGSRHLVAYEQWCHTCREQYGALSRALFMPDPEGVLPFVLRPDSHFNYFQNSISINHKGFRGPEVSDDKGNTYRIVALGASTTFGLGLNADDRPWSELLEQMIRERLKLPHNVEVINAGVPAYDVKNNVARLVSDILPLRPDMIISCEGLNGFHLLSGTLPREYARNQPMLKQRPLKLLGEAEYAVKMLAFNRRHNAELMRIPPLTNPMQTEFAAAYRELIAFADTSHIRLVLANSAMAMNAKSDPRVIAFYRRATPQIDWQIKATEIHSAIVEELVREHPEVCFVDTRPHLDGEHTKFTDPAHFDTEGDQQMAETIFAGISKMVAMP
jgi:lysophospholipase L1-like esterase